MISESVSGVLELTKQSNSKFHFSILGLKMQDGTTNLFLVDLDKPQIMLPDLELGIAAEEGRDNKPAFAARFAPRGVSTQYRIN